MDLALYHKGVLQAGEWGTPSRSCRERTIPFTKDDVVGEKDAVDTKLIQLSQGSRRVLRGGSSVAYAFESPIARM
jgi:hypothetical protein